MASLPSRKIIAAFIAVFVIGVAVGWLNALNLSGARFSGFLNRTSDPVSMASRMNQKYAADYQLTPEQQARIAPLIKEMARHLSQLRHQFGADVIATLDTYHQKIAEQMTPAQQQAYATANEKRKSRMVSLLLPDPSSPDSLQK